MLERAVNRRYAITYTVKNEAKLLPDAIAYHRELGCARIYVFFDGTTDNSRDLVRDIDGVVCADSIEPRALEDVPPWISQLLPRWQESMDVRKRINTHIAAGLARAEGIEWLINIDPDELLLLNSQEVDAIGDPEAFFTSIGGNVDQILAPNLEAVPVGEGTGRPFIDCTLFLRRFPTTEFVRRATSALLRRLLHSPMWQAWYDHWYYRVRFRGALPRLMHDPVTGASIPAGYFLGYSNHKAFIRTRTADEFRFNIHRWEKIHRRPISVKRGFILHYDLCSAEYFVEKFRQRQPAMLVKAFYCRYMFARIARESPFETARRFFLSEICISSPAVIARLLRRNIIVQINCISQRFSRHEGSAQSQRFTASTISDV
jgi:hypothetical protein